MQALNERTEAIRAQYAVASIRFFTEAGDHCASAYFDTAIDMSQESVMFAMRPETYVHNRDVPASIHYAKVLIPAPDANHEDLEKRASVRDDTEEDNGAIHIQSRKISSRHQLLVYPVLIRLNPVEEGQRTADNLKAMLLKRMSPPKANGMVAVLRANLPNECEVCGSIDFLSVSPPRAPKVPVGTKCYRCANSKCMRYEFVKPKE